MKFGIIDELFNNLSESDRLEQLIEMYNEVKQSPIAFCNALKEEINTVAYDNTLCPNCADRLVIHSHKEVHDKEDPTKTEKIWYGFCQYCRKDFKCDV